MDSGEPHAEDYLSDDDGADEVEVLEEVIDDDDEGADVEMDDDNDEAEPDDDTAHDREALTDDAEVVFTKHTGSVFCISLNPASTLAATGGVDDKAYVWNVLTGEVVLHCTGHRDSVVHTSFSHDGLYVATGDMSGLVQVWNMQTLSCIWSFEISDLEWLGWHFGTHVLFACDADSNLWMWRIPGGECKTFSGGGRTSASVASLLPGGSRACVGYGDGTIKLWDLRTSHPIHSFTGQEAHTNHVTCMERHPAADSELIMTGSVDGTANIYNCSTAKLLVSFDCRTGSTEKVTAAAGRGGGEGIGGAADAESGAFSVESVGLYKHQPLAAAGTLSNTVNIYDVPTKVCRFTLANESSIVKLRWDDSAPLLYVADLGAAVSLWDARSGRKEGTWLGHAADILDFELSCASSLLVTASEDGSARVFHLHKPER